MRYTPEFIFRSPALQKLMVSLHGVGFIAWRDDPFVLNSGIKSHVYVCGREDLTDNVPVLKDLGRVVAASALSAQPAEDNRDICLIGIPTAATPLAHAAASERDESICFRIMRETKKGHGANQGWVNGAPDNDRHCYMSIENVVTSGQSVLDALDRLAEDGYLVTDMTHLVLVDREQGGIRRICDRGYNVVPIFTLAGIAETFARLDLWDRRQVDAVAEEIRQHQFA